MHELALMEEVVSAVLDAVPEVRITRVRLEVGRLAAVVPDALRFCFDVCTRETRLDGAVLEIEEIPGRARCRACGADCTLPDVLAACPCGSPLLEVLGGHELRVKDVEVQ